MGASAGHLDHELGAPALRERRPSARGLDDNGRVRREAVEHGRQRCAFEHLLQRGHSDANLSAQGARAGGIGHAVDQRRHRTLDVAGAASEQASVGDSRALRRRGDGVGVHVEQESRVSPADGSEQVALRIPRNVVPEPLHLGGAHLDHGPLVARWRRRGDQTAGEVDHRGIPVSDLRPGRFPRRSERRRRGSRTTAG